MLEKRRQTSDYSPFGVQLSGRTLTATSVSKKYRMGYQGSEMDNEVKGAGNSYTTEFRQLDPRLGRWLSIDPKMSAWESPYVSMGNNPIWNNDPNGDTLEIGDTEQARKDILSLARDRNQQYIKFDEKNRAYLDFGDLSESKINRLKENDEGIRLIDDLVTAPEKFLYEASKLFLGHLGEDRIKYGFLVEGTHHGIVNASEWGCDSEGDLTFRPKDGYDGHVVILPGLSGSEENTTLKTFSAKSRSSTVFHELAENYERTHNGIGYRNSKAGQGAHSLAIQREGYWHGKSLMPGEYSEINIPQSTPEEREELYIIIRAYYEE